MEKHPLLGARVIFRNKVYKNVECYVAQIEEEVGITVVSLDDPSMQMWCVNYLCDYPWQFGGVEQIFKKTVAMIEEGVIDVEAYYRSIGYFKPPFAEQSACAFK